MEGKAVEQRQTNAVRCTGCNKLLGYTGSDYSIAPEASINAASYDAGEITFSVKCPRCGRVEQIIFKR